MSDPLAHGYELTPELLAELLKHRVPVALTPDEMETLKLVAKAYREKQERWASFKSNWPIIAAVVTTLTTLLTFLLTQLPQLLQGGGHK